MSVRQPPLQLERAARTGPRRAGTSCGGCLQTVGHALRIAGEKCPVPFSSRESKANHWLKLDCPISPHRTVEEGAATHAAPFFLDMRCFRARRALLRHSSDQRFSDKLDCYFFAAAPRPRAFATKHTECPERSSNTLRWPRVRLQEQCHEWLFDRPRIVTDLKVAHHGKYFNARRLVPSGNGAARL